MLIELIDQDAHEIGQQHGDPPEWGVKLAFGGVLVGPQGQQHPIDHEKQHGEAGGDFQRCFSARYGGGRADDIQLIAAVPVGDVVEQVDVFLRKAPFVKGVVAVFLENVPPVESEDGLQ